jgi:hypothetical protein
VTEREPQEPQEPVESIYGHTNTSYTVPQLNEGVPPDPRFMRVLSAVEVAIGVVLFASSSSV